MTAPPRVDQLPNLSRRELALYASLRHRRQREEHGLFVAEGEKVVEQLLHSFDLVRLIARPDHPPLPTLWQRSRADVWCTTASAQDYSRLSSLETPREVIAILSKRSPSPLTSHLCVALDAVQDPGNLGTIIRLCDWLGIRTLICGKGTVDCYNPKVVQASAGSLGAIALLEGIELSSYLPTHFDTIVGTDTIGVPLHDVALEKMIAPVCILFGNEGNGLSEDVRTTCTTLLTIPKVAGATAESLNVGISAAMVLYHLCRHSLS